MTSRIAEALANNPDLIEHQIALNAEVVAEQQESARKSEHATTLVILAVSNPEWIRLGSTTDKYPTLFHLFEDYYSSRNSPSYAAEADEIMVKILTVLRDIASGARQFKLECFRCGLSRSACNCCKEHRLYELRTENDQFPCVNCIRTAREVGV